MTAIRTDALIVASSYPLRSSKGRMDKKALTEQEIRTRFITPAIRRAGWTAPQIREEVYITDGQIHPDGKAPRGRRRFADYVLCYHIVWG